MTDAPTPTEPTGAVPLNTNNASQTSDGPKLPAELPNTPPAPEPKEETPEEKAAREKAALDETHEDPKEPPKEEPAQDTPAAEPEIPEDYISYNDEAADMAMNVLREAKVDIKEADAIFRKAAETGNMDDIDMKTLTEKVGAEKAAVIKLAVKDYYGRMMAETKVVMDAIYSAAGGQAQFETVKAWANAKEAKDPAFAAEMAAVRKMFDLGAVSGRLAMKDLVEKYNADPKNTKLAGKVYEGDKPGTQAPDRYLTRSEYNDQIKKAHEKNDIQEINRLKSLRTMAIKAGY